MSIEVSSGQVVNSIFLAEENMCVSSGGTANHTTVWGFVCMSVLAGGTANDTEVDNGGEMHISSGGTANRIVVYNEGNVCISSGGTANNATVEDTGRLEIFSGGTANATCVSGNGNLHVYSGGTANNTTINGEDWNGGNLYVYSGGVVNSTTVNNNGNLFVSSGGVANSTTMNGGGLYVSPGGTANNVNVSGGHLCVSSGASALAIVENGGYVEIAEGASATFVANSFSGLVLYDAILHSGTTANNTTVGDEGNLLISSGGVANSTYIGLEGTLHISSGGTANATYVSWNGNLHVYSGGTANNTTIEDEVWLEIHSGGKHTGMLTISDDAWDATVSAASGSIIDFDLSTVAPGGATRINDLSRIQGAPDYTITLSETQTVGSYALAEGAAAFDRTITVVTDAGSELGAISVNGELKNGEYTYRLANGDGVLALTVFYGDIIPPAAPTVTVSTAAPTNQNVIVTATFSEDSAQKQYSLDGEQWFDYTTGVVMPQNGTVYFRGIDAADNISDVTEYAVANIDKAAPDAPTVKASTTALTNQNVTVAATFSEDSAKKQYSTDKKTWKTYSKALTVSANGTYYFRGIDEAGNISDVTAYKVANIDKVMPTVTLSTTNPTNQNVTITAKFTKDAVQKQYSTDKKTWKTYSKALTVGKNGTYYFRGIDKDKKASTIVTMKVANIDKTAPAAPKLKASTTKTTNENVTIKATFSTDSAKKQYSIDKKTWKSCGKTLSVGKNGTYYFRGIDAAGNASKIVSIKVANIDKTAPAAPTVKLNTTKAASSITVTATFSKDSAKKQYSTDKKTWKTYSKALTVKANGTYYFRSIDEAGNVSKVKGVKVANVVDIANNNWSGATVLKKTVLGALEAKADAVDYYNVGDVAQLMLDMEKGKAKVSFYDKNKKAVKVSALTMADGIVKKNVSALTLTAGNDKSDNFTLAALDECVKYLKIETADKTVDNYKLAKLA